MGVINDVRYGSVNVCRCTWCNGGGVKMEVINDVRYGSVNVCGCTWCNGGGG